MTPDQKGSLPIQMEKLFYDLQKRIYSDVVRRIKKTGEITSTADYQINKLLILGNSTEFIEQEIKQLSQKSDQELWELYDKVSNWEYVRYKDAYQQINGHFVPLEENQQIRQWANAVIKQTKGDIKNITQSLGFTVDMGGGKKAFTPLSHYYQKYLDRACMDIVTGAFDYNTVLRRVVKEMTASGLKYVDYASGYTCWAPVAVRRAIMTGVSQLAAQINEQVAKDLGADTYEVTWHAGHRPSHWWGGNIYTKAELISVCRLGDVEGLCGANCRHSYLAFIPGVSVRTYTPEQLRNLEEKERQTRNYQGREYNAYEASQMQRKLETKMRSQRAYVKQLQQGGASEEDIVAARARYLNTLHQYQGFSKKMGIPEQMQRVYMDGLGRIAPGSSPYYERGITNKRIPKSVDYLINRNLIESNEYKRKYNGITGNVKTDGAIYKYAKAGLTHRDGTNREDLYIISKSTGKVLGKNITSTEAFGVRVNESIRSAVKNNQGDLIGLHTHPDNTPPTGSDFETAFKRGYYLGTVACSDGSVYTYGCADQFASARIIDDTIEKFKKLIDDSGKKVYSNDREAHLAAIKSLGKDYGIWYETR